MSYSTLAETLDVLAAKIRKNAENLAGEGAAVAAKKLTLAVKAMEKVVARAASESDPSAKSATKLLRSKAAESINFAATAEIGRHVLEKSFKPKKGEGAAAFRERLLQTAVESGRADVLLKLSESFLKTSSLPSPDSTSDSALRAELQRIGGLSREEQELELSLHITPDLLKALAALIGIKASAKGLTPKLRAQFLDYCSRLHENTSWRA